MKSKVDFKIFVHLNKIQINTECKVVKLYNEALSSMDIFFLRKLVQSTEVNGEMVDQMDGDKIFTQTEAIIKAHSLTVYLMVQEDS